MLTPFGLWLTQHAISYASAARELGISRQYVSLLARGLATPRFATLGKRIEEWTRELDKQNWITLSSWVPYCSQFDGFDLVASSKK